MRGGELSGEFDTEEKVEAPRVDPKKSTSDSKKYIEFQCLGCKSTWYMEIKRDGAGGKNRPVSAFCPGCGTRFESFIHETLIADA